MIPEEKGNAFVKELQRFIGKDVVVEDFNDKKFEGELRAIHFTYGNVIIRTPTEKIYVRNVANIRRKRSNPIEVSKKKK